jgi:GNAT superfamily N-acetyltransferase
MTGELVPIVGTNAALILAEAFAADPAMEFFIEAACEDSLARLRSNILSILVRLHELSGQSLWGWRAEDRIMGCALVEDRPNRLWQGVAMLRMLPAAMRLPKETLSRLNAYALLSQRGRPNGVTHFLTLLGMSDVARGKGHGTRFLHALDGHYGPTAHWALDTENPGNLSFYERLGYRSYATEALGPVTMFKLHRPPRPQGQV